MGIQLVGNIRTIFVRMTNEP